MLKKLTIRNFKAIQDMTIEFTPLTVLIGENSCGKSTVLQAIDFLRSAASRDIPEYLREKKWSFEELKSKCNDGKSKPIEFITLWDLLIKGQSETLEWTLSVDYNKGWVIKEKLIKPADSKPIISYRNNDQENIPASLKQLSIQSSALKYLSGISMEFDELNALFFFLSDSANFELLSPDKMRDGKKLPYAQGIGIGGEALAYCINKMNDSDRKLLNKTVSDLIHSVVEIITIDNGNKIDLLAVFISDNNIMTVDSLHISDGLLRIIAFVVITMERKMHYFSAEDGFRIELTSGEECIESNKILKSGMILLDEIENGINPYLTEKIISLLRNFVIECNRQLILTTHSPVMLNDIKPEEIIFLWKDDKSSTKSKKFFCNEEMKSLLEALNPGEVWVNLEKDDILERLSSDKAGDK